MLSFLRQEGPAYAEITSKAGVYAAEWTVRSLPTVERRLINVLPTPLRARMALRAGRMLVRNTYPGSRALMKFKKGEASVDLRGSLFCEVREASALPLCGFYAAALARVLQLFAIDAQLQVVECRASGTRKGCMFAIALSPPPVVEVPEHAA